MGLGWAGRSAFLTSPGQCSDCQSGDHTLGREDWGVPGLLKAAALSHLYPLSCDSEGSLSSSPLIVTEKPEI